VPRSARGWQRKRSSFQHSLQHAREATTKAEAGPCKAFGRRYSLEGAHNLEHSRESLQRTNKSLASGYLKTVSLGRGMQTKRAAKISPGSCCGSTKRYGVPQQFRCSAESHKRNCTPLCVRALQKAVAGLLHHSTSNEDAMEPLSECSWQTGTSSHTSPSAGETTARVVGRPQQQVSCSPPRPATIKAHGSDGFRLMTIANSFVTVLVACTTIQNVKPSGICRLAEMA
jgi:hypothetical protein